MNQEKKNHNKIISVFLYVFFKVNFYFHIQQRFPDGDQTSGQKGESDMVSLFQGPQKDVHT